MSNVIKRMVNCNVQVTACNFECEYCYLTQFKSQRSNCMPKFAYPIEHIAKALSPERMGGTCLFNFCGAGETLLPKEIPGIIKLLLKQGHYVELVTNGILTNRFKEILELPEQYLQNLEIKFSFHYKQLKEKNLFKTFFDNIRMMRDHGCSFTYELVPTDDLIPLIDEIKEVCMREMGALCHVTVPRNEATFDIEILTKLSREEFEKAWSSFDSGMFKYKLSTFNVEQKNFCYAGMWTLFLDLSSGIAKQCYCTNTVQNIYEDLSKPICFQPIGKCFLPHCYNSHVLLVFGNIPAEKTSATYNTIRNRKCQDGSEFITEHVQQAFNSKFYESWPELSPSEQKCFIRKGLLNRFKFKLHRDLRVFKRKIFGDAK